MVDSVLYRMKALQQGDRYFIKTLVQEERKKQFYEFMLFLVGYSIMTAVVVSIGVFEMEDTPSKS